MYDYCAACDYGNAEKLPSNWSIQDPTCRVCTTLCTRNYQTLFLMRRLSRAIDIT